MTASNTIFPTDSYVPDYLKTTIPELESFTKLQEKETSLDRFLIRKRTELQELAQETSADSLTPSGEDNIKDNKILRIYISNLSTEQPWQEPEVVNPQWTLRIEGRLLDSNFKPEDPTRPKFSSFLSSIALDFEQPQVGEKEDKEEEEEEEEGKNANGENGTLADPFSKQPLEIVEWHENPHGPPVEFDGLDVKRSGSKNVNCKITIQPKNQTSNLLEYSEPLSNITCCKNGSLQKALHLLYIYITSNKFFDTTGNILLSSSLLQQLVKPVNNTPTSNTNSPSTALSVDSTITTTTTTTTATTTVNNNIPTNNEFSEETMVESMSLLELNELVAKRHVFPIPPLVIPYTIRCDKASTYGETCFDIVLNNYSAETNNGNSFTQIFQDYLKDTETIDQDIGKADSKINELMVQLNNTYHRHQFYSELSKDPVNFLNKYIESSSNMMKVLSGDEGFQEDEVRKSDFYKNNAGVLYEDIAIMFANGRI